MKDKLSALVAIVLLLVLAGVSYWYSVTVNFGYELSPTLPDSPNLVSGRLVVTEFDKSGRPKLRYFADSTERYNDDRVVGHNVEFVTLRPDEPRTRGIADRGESFNNGEYVVFTGNVRLHRDGADGAPPTELSTESLTAYPDTQTFTSDLPVHVVRGEDSTDGVGMVYRNTTRKVHFQRDVTTVLASRREADEP